MGWSRIDRNGSGLAQQPVQGQRGFYLLTILIVDDSALIRRALRSTIEHNPELYVCGETENGKIAVDQVKQLRPDIVILDLRVPVMNGLEAARQITEVAPSTVMLMYTMHCPEQLLRDAQAAGTQKVVSRSDGGPNQLVEWLSNGMVRPERRNQSMACRFLLRAA